MLKRLFSLSDVKVALIITLGVVVAFFLNSFNPQASFLNLIDKKWVDFILKERDKQAVVPQVALAVIDTKSVDYYGRWPWPRERMAQLVDALNEYGARTIGFDIVFSEPEHNTGREVLQRVEQLFGDYRVPNSRPLRAVRREMGKLRTELDGDQKLAQSLSRNKNVVLGYFFFNAMEQVEHLTEEERNKGIKSLSGQVVNQVRGEINKGMLPGGVSAETNIPLINQSSRLQGYFNMIPDSEDGTVRRVHLLTQFRDSLYPSLDLQILRHFLGADQIKAESSPEHGIQGCMWATGISRLMWMAPCCSTTKAPPAPFPIIRSTILSSAVCPGMRWKAKSF